VIDKFSAEQQETSFSLFMGKEVTKETWLMKAVLGGASNLEAVAASKTNVSNTITILVHCLLLLLLLSCIKLYITIEFLYFCLLVCYR
jgi:hypothetical protein